MDIRQQLLAAFEVEYREHLDAIRTALAAAAEGRLADWTDVFRRAHSLKGAARAVDLPPVEALAHRLETLFERIAAGDRALDHDTAAAIHLALDRIETFVGEPEGGGSVMSDDALAALESRLAGAQEPESRPAQPRAADPPPSPSEPAAEAGSAVLRVPAAAVEALTQATHGLAATLQAEAGLAEALSRIAAEAGELRQSARTLAGQRQDTEGGRAALGALEAGLARLARGAALALQRQQAFAIGLDTASARLREEAERLALVPAETVFGGFARAIREIARDEGRDVDVAVRGLDLPVDRAMLQTLKDPVLHALRNALSHGAESADARQRAGKPQALAILFEVAVQGGRLVIGIHDDGRGLDLAGIEARARAAGLLAPGETAEPERIAALAFETGLSTAASVDTLSGRGLGLSIVAEAARRLQGSVRLAPRQPHGTSLIIDLPLAAAQRALVIVDAGGSAYAVPSAAVERVLQLDRAQLDTAAGHDIVRIGEGEAQQVLALAGLETLVGAPAAERPPRFPALVLRSGDRRCAVAVERLRDVRRLLVLPPPPMGAEPGLVAGTVILGHDRPVLVLNPDGLIARLDRASAQAASFSQKPYTEIAGTMPGNRRSTILVVDDSITTRTLEKSILEAAGYRVVVCVDGQDALDRLRAGIEPVDLVVADVEMPRLDGFGLLKALRDEAAFAELPVILMTSRGDAEDVAKGLELGADAYLTKQKFDQRELLDTVSQLL